MSTKTGTAPIIATVLAEATKENADVITSSPGPTPTAFRARTSASVPELRPMPWRAPHEGGQLRLERRHLGPEDEAAAREHARGRRRAVVGERGVLAHEVDLRDHGAQPPLVPNWPMPRRLMANRNWFSLPCR